MKKIIFGLSYITYSLVMSEVFVIDIVTNSNIYNKKIGAIVINSNIYKNQSNNKGGGFYCNIWNNKNNKLNHSEK